MYDIYLKYFKGFRFESPWFLLFLIPLVLFIIISVKRGIPTLTIPWIKPFIVSKHKKKFKKTSIPFVLYCIAAFLLVFALARPQQGIEQLKQRTEGIDIMLALDLSGSMQGIDIPKEISSQEVNSKLQSGEIKKRIDYAKEEIEKFIEKRPNDRIGLIAFAPKPYVACPPTLDHAWLVSHLRNVDAGIIGDSTNIAAPITSAISRLKDLDSKRKVLVLFTDGQNNVNDRVSPLQAAQLAKKYDIVIYTVGIGSNNAYVLQSNMFGQQQLFPLYDQFDEKLLKDIAKETDGKYYEAANAEGLNEVMDQIDKLEKTTSELPRFIDYSEFGPKIILLALILFILGFIGENTIFLILP